MVGMIKKEDVEKVRAAADLYDIVSATVTLKPSGTGTFVGLCPFHDEKTGSFNVRPSLGVWHCFGCGLGGDVFKYVEQSENIDFREAVELLADKYHIELHYENSGNGPARENTGSKRTRLLEACEEAQRFFVSRILTKEALPARKLLGGRNFSQADCERFGCGYAPQGWDNLVRHLASKGFTQKEILDAGLARQGQRGIYDYFRGRVTWPIRDSTGRTLGFGARKLYEDDQDLLEDVLIEIKQAIEMSSIYLNILSGTMDAFASVISNNLNIVMKVLASITIVISIPNIIAGFYGMNVEGLPLAQFFWFPIVLALVLMGVVSWILHKKNML